MAKKTLKAVHDDDLEAVLKALGVYGAFVNGKLKCAFCKNVIDFASLHSLFPDSGAVKASCSESSCVIELLARLESIGIQ